jgi:hypothetical protein
MPSKAAEYRRRLQIDTYILSCHQSLAVSLSSINHLSIYLFIICHLSIYHLSIFHQSVCLQACMSVYMYLCTVVCIYVCLYLLSIYLSIYLSLTYIQCMRATYLPAFRNEDGRATEEVWFREATSTSHQSLGSLGPMI